MRADELDPRTPTAFRGSSDSFNTPARTRVVDIVIHVGDEIGDAHDLPFERGRAVRLVDPHRRSLLAFRVAPDTVANFEREVQSLPSFSSTSTTRRLCS